MLTHSRRKQSLGLISVPDPNRDPPDPHVFGPPGSGSGSISQRYGSGSGFGSGSLHHYAKILRKTLISIVLWHLFDFLSLKNYVHVPSKSNMQKNVMEKISFLLVSWRSMMKIAGSGSRSGSGSESGSISQSHGSADPDPQQNVKDPQHWD